MQTTENLLRAIGTLGQSDKPLTRMYRHLYNRNLWLQAYDNISTNKGALTPGVDGQTVDGMSLEKIDQMIDHLKKETYRWHPVRPTYIPKANGGRRPLGIPTFNDRLLQEVIRMLLNAYYEPQFSENSHGFRPNRGCQTALRQVKQHFRAVVWFIEGDIKGCFENINHETLMVILKRNIHDNRLLRLIYKGLKAGVINQDWSYETTYSGVPQGGVLSPLLANVYLHDLDTFVETVLIPQWTKGAHRQRNTEYRRLEARAYRAKTQDERSHYHKLMKQVPIVDPQDQNYRRLKYVRYADDIIFGFVGTKAEAEEIRQQLAEYLNNYLQLTLSMEKTLVTNAVEEQAHFLGYAISVARNNKLLKRRSDGVKQRFINGLVTLRVPKGLPAKKAQRYLTNGKTRHRGELLNNSIGDIVYQFQAQWRGLAEYYRYALDRHELSGTKFVMEQVLVKTLAAKLRISSSQVYRRFGTTVERDGRRYKVLKHTVKTATKTLTFIWGGIPLRYESRIEVALDDQANKIYWYHSTDRVTRMLAQKCELCECEDVTVQAHHVNNLSALQRQKRAQGKPLVDWQERMIRMNRKTLYVCQECHWKIHHGEYDGPRIR